MPGAVVEGEGPAGPSLAAVAADAAVVVVVVVVCNPSLENVSWCRFDFR